MTPLPVTERSALINLQDSLNMAIASLRKEPLEEVVETLKEINAFHRVLMHYCDAWNKNDAEAEAEAKAQRVLFEEAKTLKEKFDQNTGQTLELWTDEVVRAVEVWMDKVAMPIRVLVRRAMWLQERTVGMVHCASMANSEREGAEARCCSSRRFRGATWRLGAYRR